MSCWLRCSACTVGHLIRHRLAKLHRDWKRLQGESPAWLVMAVATAFIAGLGLWLPSMNYDDNAAHLILPYQLLEDGYYHLDVSTQAWAVPIGRTTLNGIAALLAGPRGSSSSQFPWLLIGLNGAWRRARVRPSPWWHLRPQLHTPAYL